MAHQHQHMTGSHGTLGLLVPLGCAHTEEPQSLEQNERATGTTTTAQGSGPTWMPYLAPMTERSISALSSPDHRIPPTVAARTPVLSSPLDTHHPPGTWTPSSHTGTQRLLTVLLAVWA